MITMTNESYRLLKSAGDEMLINYLRSRNEEETFHEFKKWIINEEIDKYNTLLPGEIMRQYYNYCLTNFKNK